MSMEYYLESKTVVYSDLVEMMMVMMIIDGLNQ